MKRGYLKCLEILYAHVDHMHWEQVGKDGPAGYIDNPGPIDFAELIAWLAARNYGRHRIGGILLESRR